MVHFNLFFTIAKFRLIFKSSILGEELREILLRLFKSLFKTKFESEIHIFKMYNLNKNILYNYYK
jgi:hypothetical protein